MPGQAITESTLCPRKSSTDKEKEQKKRKKKKKKGRNCQVWWYIKI